MENKIPKEDKKLLTVTLSYNSHSNNYFVDFWDAEGKIYIVSIKISQGVAAGISRDTNIKIFE